MFRELGFFLLLSLLFAGCAAPDASSQADDCPVTEPVWDKPLEAELSCCYPTRFQPAGLLFPTPGCWEVSAKAAGAALSFVVWVEP